MIKKLLKKDLLVSFSSYTIINLLSTAIPYILLPVLTYYLTTSDYGILTNIQALFNLFIPILGLNIAMACSRQYFKKEIVLNEYIGTSLITIIVTFLIVLGFVFLSNEFLTENTQIPFSALISVVFYAFFHNVIEILLALWRMENSIKKFGIFKISRIIIEISLSLILVVIYLKGWEGRYYMIVLTTFLFFIVALYLLWKNNYISLKFNKAYFKHFLNYGFFLIPHAVSGMILVYSDKFIITNLLGIEENGIYSVGMQIGMVIALIQNSFNQAWVPWFFSKLTDNKESDKLKIVKITYIYSGLLLLLSILLWLFSPIIYTLLNSDYIAGMAVVPLIGLTFALNGIYKMFANYIFYSEKTYILSIISFATAALNIYINFQLIPIYGIVGAAYASLICAVIQLILIIFISKKLYKMPWGLKIKNSLLENG